MASYRLKLRDTTAPEPAFIGRMRRLGAAAPDLDGLAHAFGPSRMLPSRGILAGEREASPQARVLHSGWAARTRLLADGRRQILEILLPGDILEPIGASIAFSQETTVALTEVEWATLDMAAFDGAALSEARERVRALRLCYLHNQIGRLGRQTAYERMAHLMLELRDRLTLAGLNHANAFPMPLTQELLADVLGLTTVHVNRTMQQLRRESMFEVSRTGVVLLDPDMLASISDYARPRL